VYYSFKSKERSNIFLTMLRGHARRAGVYVLDYAISSPPMTLSKFMEKKLQFFLLLKYRYTVALADAAARAMSSMGQIGVLFFVQYPYRRTDYCALPVLQRFTAFYGHSLPFFKLTNQSVIIIQKSVFVK